MWRQRASDNSGLPCGDSLIVRRNHSDDCRPAASIAFNQIHFGAAGQTLKGRDGCSCLELFKNNVISLTSMIVAEEIIPVVQAFAGGAESVAKT